MKRTYFSFLAVAVLLQSPLVCMEQQRLLLAKPENILNTPLSQLFVQGTSYQQPAPTSQRLADVLKERNPDHDPLFAQDQRAENMALITSIGAHNTRAKLFGIASAFCVLNAIKDITAVPIWGFLQQFPLTDVIPPNHLMSLHPCYQQCYMNGCCMDDCDGEPCLTICDGPWVCTPDTPDPVLNKLGGASMFSFSVNVAGALGTGALSIYHWGQAGRAEKSLSTLLSQLEDATHGIPNPESTTTPSANPIRDLFDKQLAQDLTDKDQEAFNTKRQEHIDLMKTAGATSSQYKLCMLLVALFGINALKDAVLVHFWGRDTIYPLTPLLEHNKSTPLTPCKQICWISCPVGENCVQVCESQCVDEKQIVNSFGYTSVGSMAANFIGLLTAGVIFFRSSNKSHAIKKELAQHLRELDQLLASTEEDI